MSQSDDVKWALIDLLKLLDVIYGGVYHVEFSRIAKTLGVELPPLPQVEDEPPLDELTAAGRRRTGGR